MLEILPVSHEIIVTKWNATSSDADFSYSDSMLLENFDLHVFIQPTVGKKLFSSYESLFYYPFEFVTALFFLAVFSATLDAHFSVLILVS